MSRPIIPAQVLLLRTGLRLRRVPRRGPGPPHGAGHQDDLRLLCHGAGERRQGTMRVVWTYRDNRFRGGLVEKAFIHGFGVLGGRKGNVPESPVYFRSQYLSHVIFRQ